MAASSFPYILFCLANKNRLQKFFNLSLSGAFQGIFFSFQLFLLIILGFASVRVPLGQGVPSYGTRPCDRTPYDQPFPGVSACVWVPSRCTAVQSIFTWTAQDFSVDSGYSRVKNFFVPQGWQYYDDNVQQELPMRLSTKKQLYPSEQGILPSTLWNQSRKQSHVNIAYGVLAPIVATGLTIFITQFEFPQNHVDSNNLPLPTAHSVRTTFWSLSVHFNGDGTGKILALSAFPAGSILGHIIATKQTPITVAADLHKLLRFSLKAPPLQQNLTQRWSCQKIDYTSESSLDS